MDRHHVNGYGVEPFPRSGSVSDKKIRTCFSFTPNLDEFTHQLNDIFESGLLSNFGKYNRRLEQQLAEFLKVEFVFTVPNASTGLQILLSTLPKSSEVIVPSFTFPATVHAVVHAGLRPVFVDINPETFTISIRGVLKKITQKTSAILAVHIFGNPCAIDLLEWVAGERGLKLFFDAACSLGSKYRGRCIGGFGDAEMFSLSGPKIITAGEGGVITTNDKELAEKICCYRNYGYSPDKSDCWYVGVNGKLDEISALFALSTLNTIDEQIAQRKELTKIYRRELEAIPGIQFQRAQEGGEINYSSVAIKIDSQKFGVTASELKDRLKTEGIETIRYFTPPVHKTTAYKDFNNLKLGHTEKLSQSILCLPMHSKLDGEQVQYVCDAIKRIHRTAHPKSRRPMEKVKLPVEAYAPAAA
jgi:dTDP-4-amino-4,6-dideoxyglucose